MSLNLTNKGNWSCVVERSVASSLIAAVDTSITAKSDFPFKSTTSNNQRTGSALDDLDPRLSLLCQVGDDVIRPCKICGGCQIRVPRSIHSMLSHKIWTPICIRGVHSFYVERNKFAIDVNWPISWLGNFADNLLLITKLFENRSN